MSDSPFGPLKTRLNNAGNPVAALGSKNRAKCQRAKIGQYVLHAETGGARTTTHTPVLPGTMQARKPPPASLLEASLSNTFGPVEEGEQRQSPAFWCKNAVSRLPLPGQDSRNSLIPFGW